MKDIGIGTDCIEISRFNDIKQNAIERIFTDKEIEYCKNMARPAEHFAARFAGKEAIIKSLSRFGQTIEYRDIEILNDRTGIPCTKIKGFEILISLSHAKDIAIAFAIAKNENK